MPTTDSRPIDPKVCSDRRIPHRDAASARRKIWRVLSQRSTASVARRLHRNPAASRTMALISVGDPRCLGPQTAPEAERRAEHGDAGKDQGYGQGSGLLRTTSRARWEARAGSWTRQEWSFGFRPDHMRPRRRPTDPATGDHPGKRKRKLRNADPINPHRALRHGQAPGPRQDADRGRPPAPGRWRREQRAVAKSWTNRCERQQRVGDEEPRMGLSAARIAGGTTSTRLAQT